MTVEDIQFIEFGGIYFLAYIFGGKVNEYVYSSGEFFPVEAYLIWRIPVLGDY